MRLTTMEDELLQAEHKRCADCRAGAGLPCDGFYQAYDERASVFYGSPQFCYVPCPYYRTLQHANARAVAIQNSGLPSKWSTEKPPALPPALLDGKSCVVSPRSLDAKQVVEVTHLVQASVMGRLEAGKRGHYIFCPGLEFDHLRYVIELLHGDDMMALDRWDGGSPHEALLAQLCGAVERRLQLGTSLVVGLLRPCKDLEPRVGDEGPLIQQFRAMEQHAV